MLPEGAIPEINITRKRKKAPPQQRRQPFKALRMAEYFKPSSAAMSALAHSAMDTSDMAAFDRSAISAISHAAPINERSHILQDLTVLEEKRKEALDKKLEQDILDNVDINFIFYKGSNLGLGLIDQDRLYSIMNKLKELAFKQLQQGSK